MIKSMRAANTKQGSTVEATQDKEAVPTLLYGCENWTARKGRKVRTESAEMKVLRSVAEFALHDQRTNEAVREELNVYDLLWTVHSVRHNIY